MIYHLLNRPDEIETTLKKAKRLRKCVPNFASSRQAQPIGKKQVTGKGIQQSLSRPQREKEIRDVPRIKMEYSP